MNELSGSIPKKIILEDEEKNRLVRFFDVLIEMDFEDKRNKRSKDTTNVLLFRIQNAYKTEARLHGD